MAKAETLVSSPFVKMIMMGASGVGKTCALKSLLADGYKVRILDMDSNVNALLIRLREEAPELLEQLDVIQCADKFRVSQVSGLEVAGQPKAYTEMLKYLTKWDDETVPSQWGDKHVLVIDTLTSVGRAAFQWAKGMNPTSKDPRQWYGAAQESIKTMLEMLASKEFQTNVVIMSHIELTEMPDGASKQLVASVGKALGPQIPKNFGTLVLAETKGSGANTRRVVQTLPTGTADLKAENPFKIEKELPLDTSLSTIFRAIKA